MDKIRLPLTRLQRRVLYFIYEFIREKQYPPTVTEVQEKLFIANPGTVHKVIGALEKKGYLTREKHTARGVRLTPLGEEVGSQNRQLLLELAVIPAPPEKNDKTSNISQPQEGKMEAVQEIMHENCHLGQDYLIEMGGREYHATFKGYHDNNQYAPTFEIVSREGSFRVIRPLE
jgi:SOS-response transcriptional repressor LexA